MSTSTDWTCGCRAVNAGAAVWCEACGQQRPDRASRGAPKLPEMQHPARLPTYPEPSPGDDALIRAEIARGRALLGLPPTPTAPERPTPARLGLAIDPAIRAELARRNAAGPEPVGALLGRVLKAR